VDADWERSIPFYNISLTTTESIFRQFDERIYVFGIDRVPTGCRNSNYAVSTSRGRFFMQICPESVARTLSRESLAAIGKNGVSMPEMLYCSGQNPTGRLVMIYEFIEGVPLEAVDMNDDVIEQVAGAAAGIHHADIRNDGTYISLDDYPAFFGWYDMFLSREPAVSRLDPETVARIKALIGDNLHNLQRIEQYESFIHCDFRPANMILGSDGGVFITDWEFAGFGHTLADIGQFFRYGERFSSRHAELFFRAYNRRAARPLPDEWYALAKLRDLVNPLQMLGSRMHMPNRERDLIRVVNHTLEYFGY